MDQQVAYAQNAFLAVLADDNLDDRSVLLGHNAVQRQGKSDPLVLFDSAVVMRVQKGKAFVFVKGILLYVQAGRIDVRAQNVHAAFKRLFSDLEKRDDFSHRAGVDLVSGL